MTGTSHTIVSSIALCTVTATALALLMKLLRQPLILGYLLAGFLIGPVGLGLVTGAGEIEMVSQVGLILLLFVVGLEIDLTRMISAGRTVALCGLLQFPICAGLAFLVLWGTRSAAATLGIFSPGVPSLHAVLYTAVALALSSTLIVVKLLYDTMELDTVAGRLTVGILIFQDIWAIVVLAIQPNLSDPRLPTILRTFGMGAMLVSACLLAGRYVLPRVFQFVAKLPELLLVLSLAWCFLICLVAGHPLVGLSMEMGALIAGISLASFPYNLDVIAKVVTIRDFFTTLFFMALGMRIPAPTSSLLFAAVLLALLALGIRVVGVYGLATLLQTGRRPAILTAFHLSQVSEFSLVILALGVSAGHIPGSVLTLLLWVFAFLAVGSTYLITYSDPLQRWLARLLDAVGLRERHQALEEGAEAEERPIVLLGFYRIASAFVDEARRRDPRLLRLITVVDFNLEIKPKLAALSVHMVYGDLGNPDTLHHAAIHRAKLVASTVPDTLLKGTTNAKLLAVARRLCKDARVIVAAEGPLRAKELYEAGADYVLEPAAEAGHSLLGLIEGGLRDTLDNLRDADRAGLTERREILP